MSHRVLMVAFHFPPAAMGSGHLRTLGFARYLPEFGWNPIVLSASAMAYPRTAPLQEGAIPRGCEVHRAFALDAGRHLAVAGKYPGFIAQPDRWASWCPAAVAQGLRLIRRYRIDAIWSTYPIMTAHWIAHALSRRTGLPWVADFRDPVAGSVSNANRFAVASQQRWEKRVLRDAAHVVFTTPGSMQACADKFPVAYAEGRLSVIGNGYDEAAFTDLPRPKPASSGRPLVMVHSGLLYPDGRDPVPFFTALAQLRDMGHVGPDDINVILRASGFEPRYADELKRLGIGNMVTLAPPISNHDALVEQASVDALLLFQGARFNHQIPAKIYEYLRIGLPIFALVSASGDTAAFLRDTGAATMVAMDDSGAIQKQLACFIDALRSGRLSVADRKVVENYSRFRGAETLAALLQATKNGRVEKMRAAEG